MSTGGFEQADVSPCTRAHYLICEYSSLTLDDPDSDEKAKVGVGRDRGEEGEDGGDEDAQTQHPLAAVQLGQPPAGVLWILQRCHLKVSNRP